MKNVVKVAVLAMFSSILLPALSAQTTTGTITGRVIDASGSSIPKVAITLNNLGTQATRTILTDDQGGYTLTQLPPGNYTLSAELKGFQTVEQQNISVQVNVNLRIDLTLQPASLQQRVEVVATAPVLQTESATIGGVVGNASISSLPLNGRNFIQLVALMPGTAPTAKLQSGGIDYTTSVFGGDYVINGAPADGSSYMFDGIEMRDVVDTRVSFQPTIDAIQEFNLQETNYSAAFGRAAGGIVNIVSHSGTDQFHGAAWEYIRNNDLDGRPHFANSRLPFRQNQFGGAVGGPILTNRTFFFVSYEGFRQTKSVSQAVSVPTIAERSGDFSGLPTIYNPNQIDPSTGLRVAFPGNQIPASDMSPVALKALSLFPLPSLPGTSNNLIGTATQLITTDQINVRIDQKLRKADQLSGRFTDIPRANRLFPFVFSALPNFPVVYDSPAQNAFIAETHIFGTGAANEFKIGLNRNKQILQDPQEGTNVDQQLGITGTTTQPKLLRNPNINIAGLSGTGAIGNAPNDRTDSQYSVLDNFTSVNGSVTYLAGVSVVRMYDNGGANSGDSGTFGFTGTFTGQVTPSGSVLVNTDSPVADFLLGYPATATRCCVTGNGFRNWRKTDFGTYFEADWKVRPNFTANLGVRYEIFEAPFEKSNRVAVPDLAVAPQAVLLYAGQNGVPRGFYNASKDDVSPRIGLTYSPDSKTVLRAGYGIFFLSPQLINAFSMSAQYPFTEVDTFNSNPLVPQLTLANAFPSTLTGVPSLTFTTISSHYRTPYVQSWNASVQRQVGLGTTLTASYVGTKGTALTITNVPANAPAPGPGSLGPRRPIPGFGNITEYTNLGFSTYNALQVKAERHLSNNLSFLGSYVWSKCIDDGASAITYGGNNGAIKNPADPALNKGLCDEDQRQSFLANAIYALPFGSHSSGLVRQVVSGWVIEGILTLDSGQPLSVLMPNDNSNTGINLDTPNLVSGQNPNNGPKTVQDWFNLNAFTQPAPFTFGTAGRNIVIGPPLRDFDFSLHKRFAITQERQALEFRAEFFNSTNTTSFYQPGRVFGTSTFGKISGAFDPREIQFALKYLF